MARFQDTTRGLLTIYASTLLSGGWAMIIPTIPVLVEHFGVSPGWAAQVITAFGAGRFVGTAAGGWVLDHLGTRTALVIGPLIAGVAALLTPAAPWLGVILALALVMGAGDSLWSSAREIAAIDLALKQRRGRVVSSLHGTHNVGLALCPLLGGFLTEAFGFKAAFFAYAVSALSAVALGFNIPDAGSRPVSTGPRGEGNWKATMIAPRLSALYGLYLQIQPRLRATYLVLVLGTLAAQSQRIIVQSMLPLYAGSQLGFTPTQVGLLFSISGVFVFAMILPTGYIMDRVGRKWTTVPSTGIPALAFVAIPFSESFVELAFLVSLTGLANGLSLGSMATSTYDVVPQSARGRLQAVRRTVAEIGGIFAPLAGGYLANKFHPGIPFLVYAPLLVLSALLLALVARETLER
ncbi:MAG TPA: MFS transporter [Candidatus Acidoferrales bacterium]|nr:MFS transporter [Candidatus Acidoferrales bacterium]